MDLHLEEVKMKLSFYRQKITALLRFMFENISLILIDLNAERTKRNSSTYKTLVDTLVEFIKTLGRYSWDEDGLYIVSEKTKELISRELEELEKFIRESMCQKNYKNYYYWVSSYQKLITSRNKFKSVIEYIQHKEELKRLYK